MILACILGYEKRTDLGGHPRSVRWSEFHQNAPGKAAWRNMYGHKEQYLTHWSPLPLSPEQEAQEQYERISAGPLPTSPSMICRRCTVARARMTIFRLHAEPDGYVMPLTTVLCAECILPQIEENRRVFEENKGRHRANARHEQWINGGLHDPTLVVESLRAKV